MPGNPAVKVMTKATFDFRGAHPVLAIVMPTVRRCKPDLQARGPSARAEDAPERPPSDDGVRLAECGVEPVA
jgi:hypothetical protein